MIDITRRPWRTDEDRFLREQYGVLTTRAIAKQLGRAPTAIRQYAYRHGLTQKTESKQRPAKVTH